MKNIFKSTFLNSFRYGLVLIWLLMLGAGIAVAQDSTEAPVVKKVKPVKNTFGSVWLIDNQTVLVPIKGTLEVVIQHRFGTVNNGSKDMFGLWAPSNIRVGMNYSPLSKLYLGAGVTKERAQVDVNAKYLIFEQTPGKIPVSVAVFGNAVMDTRNKKYFLHGVDRYSYFSQLIVARKITENFSAQVAGSLSWFNNVEAYVNSKGEIISKMHNGHLAVSVLGRYKFTKKSAFIAGYDQPLTQHLTNNPHPNICFGFETTTSSHAFQVFLGNYYGIVPQSNNMYNQNDYRDGQFVIGFNITHLWNF